MDYLLPEGVRSQFLGPLWEWVLSCTAEEWAAGTNDFWEVIEGLINREPGSYDDLPEWMTEIATEQLEAKN